MTEERNCLNCGYYNADRCERLGGCCFHHSKWQPISKKAQMTEEEAMLIYQYIGDGHVEFIKRLKQLGYIRKSSLVELVKEAEWMYENYRSEDYCLTIGEALEKNHQALQALKKDHPDFGGKK
jgi:hypothetical protein